jgi:hypothetical protein
MILRKLFLSIVVLAVSISCESNKQPVLYPDFDGHRAFGYIEKQVSFGPRVPGSENSRNCLEYFIRFFDSLGVRNDTMQFMHNDKTTGKPINMVNVIATFDGIKQDSEERYILAAHYDSRPRAEYDPDPAKRDLWIDGANDGASGVAVLMELAGLLTVQKPRVGFDIVLLDGEDFGRPGDLDEYFLGAKDLILRDIKGKYKGAIVVDMVGDKDLQIFKEEYSYKYSSELTDQVWQTAREMGESVFVDSVKHAIHDDHLSFMTIKLPSVVIIDFDYKYWHTMDDTPDKCSPESLASVGRVLTNLIYRL